MRSLAELDRILEGEAPEAARPIAAPAPTRAAAIEPSPPPVIQVLPRPATAWRFDVQRDGNDFITTVYAVRIEEPQ